MTIDWATATETELRDAEAPHPQTIEELDAFVRVMAEREHDYGTCVYAMSLSAVAAFNFIAHKLGVTGFQASCADLDILRHTRNLKWGRIIDYEQLLYPQYRDHFPTWDGLLAEHRERLSERAAALLAQNPHAAVAVLKHWTALKEPHNAE